MTVQTDREAFEAWYLKNMHGLTRDYPFLRNSFGDYQELSIHSRWQVWQAATKFASQPSAPAWIPVSQKPKAEHCGTTLLVLCKNPLYEKQPDWEQPLFVDCSHFDGDDFGICAEVVAYMLAPAAELPTGR